MNTSGKALHRYFSVTHSLLYSYLISVPLLLLYEVLIFLAQPDTDQVIRISVDIWIRRLFLYFGQHVLSLTLIFVALLGVFILYRERHELSLLKPRYFFFMLIEASVFAFVLALLISTTVSSLLQMMPLTPGGGSLSILQKVALSLGAGLYEELFFRVILVSALLFLFKKLFRTKNTAFAVAIILAAAIFSFVHYIGVLGDPFTIASFLFRFLFGLALNAIYICRGFGMAAWTHAIYDLMVIL